jgi:hypothetical protein
MKVLPNTGQVKNGYYWTSAENSSHELLELSSINKISLV